LDEPGTGTLLLRHLLGQTFNCGMSLGGDLDPETARALKARWTKFVEDHREAIKARRRFQVGDPGITPDLLPAQWKLKPPGLPPWP